MWKPAGAGGLVSKENKEQAFVRREQEEKLFILLFYK